MASFEYRVFTYNNRAIMNNDETLEKELLEIGDNGWELVSSVPIVSGDGSEGNMDIRTEDLSLFLKERNKVNV